MSDLSADEARRAAEWLESIGWPESARELRKYADPPETVESLRAELAAEREELVIAQGIASDVRAALENWQRRAVAAEEDRVSLNVELVEARDDVHAQRAYLAHYRRKGVADDAELARLRATPTLTPVGEHPGPGTRGLLPVKVDDDNEWNYDDDFTYVCDVNSETGRTILADPRPDDAP